MHLLSRRNFLKNSFLSSVIFVTCSGELYAAITPQETILVLHKDLFPDSIQTPQIDMINSQYYLSSVILNHSRIDYETKIFIRDGIRWLNEEAVAKYKRVYAKLPEKKREKILENIVETDWGENWLDYMMTYILEAMLGDPVYGINIDKSGWEWLNHQAGYPRPKKAFL